MASHSVTFLSCFPADFFIVWKDDVINVRNLYRERKYRRCAVLCLELLKEAMHPVHRTFLHFYQAICYESLGHIAHNYSSNKIPLFEQARDAFIAASETLPLPSLRTTDGDLKLVGPSPMCATLEVAKLYDMPSPSSIYPSPSPKNVNGQGVCTDSTAPTPSNRIPRTYSVPRFDDYSHSPRGVFEPTTPAHREHGSNFLTPFTPDQNLTIRNHKNRLSQTLSTKHILAEELVPSPLFSRDTSSKKESGSESHSHTSTQSLPIVILPSPQVRFNRPLPPTPINRPLPSLPFNHNPQFIRKGKRFVVVPRRKTALSTLISRFEGKVPFGDGSPLTLGGIDQEEVRDGYGNMEKTPVTERFRRISAIFGEKEEGTMSDRRIVQQNLVDCAIDNTNKNSINRPDGFYHGTVSSTTSNIDSDKENINASPVHKQNYSPKRLAPTSPIKSSIPRLQKTTKYPSTPKTPCPTYKRSLSPSKPKLDANPEAKPKSNIKLSTPVPTITIANPPRLRLHPSSNPTNPPANPPAAAAPSSPTYPSLLLSLHTQLTTYTTTLTTTILQIHQLQLQHDQEKRSRFLATYTSHRSSSLTSPTSPTNLGCKTRNGNRGSRITPSKDARLRSFWSLRDAQVECSGGRGSTLRDKNNDNSRTSGPCDNDDEITRRKRDRISRLKKSEWIVGKEKVGFKGVEYYRCFVGRVEGELDGEGR